MLPSPNRLFALAALLIVPLLTSAQTFPNDATPPGPPPRGPFIDNLDDVKKQIDATPEEWKVIGPQLRTVIALARALDPASALGGPPNGNPFFRGPRGGPGGPGGPGNRDSFSGPGKGPEGPPPPDRSAAMQPGTQPARGPGGPPGMAQSPMSQALAELQSALTDATTTPAQLQAKLDQVRAARQIAQAALAAAQKDLATLLTFEQQAVLTSLGYLD